MKCGVGFYASAAALALSVGCGGALAQQATPEAPSTTAPTPAATADAKGTNVESITVTATKRSSELSKTPVAISAISATALDEAHVQDVEDITHFVPGFEATHQGDHDVITLTLRGIGNDLSKTEQADPEVSIYVDGVYSPRAEGATTLLYDMDRVEVLRGPQGTLWGRNSTGGAVNFVTAKPTLDETYANVEVGGGSYNAFETKGAINLPIDKTFGIRVAFADAQHDGYVSYQSPPNIPGINRNLFVSGGDKYNGQDQRSARFSMLWEPRSNITWNVSYEYYSDKSPPDLFLMQEPRQGQQLFSALVSIPPSQDRGSDSLRSRVDWDINDYLSLSYIAGFQWQHGFEDYDQSGGAVLPTSISTPGSAIQEDRTNFANYFNYSHELNLRSSGTHLIDWITGLYYSHENNNIRFDINQFDGTLQGPAGGFNGSFIQPDEQEESEAVFGQATYHVTDFLRFTGGLRYTRDEKSNNGGVDLGCFGTQANGQPCVTLNTNDNPLLVGYAPFSNFNPQTGQQSFTNTGSAQWERLTWLARGEVDITPDLLGYVSIGTGYKSGGLFDGGGRFGPENLTSYEVGAKARLFGGQVTWNNAAYYEDFKGFQFSQPLNVFDASGKQTGTSLFTTNAEGATGYGLESELTARVTPEDTLKLEFALEHTELGNLITENTFIQQAAVFENLKGNQLPHAPAFSGTAGWDHRFDLPNGGEIVTHWDTHIETASYLSVFNFGSFDRQGAYTRSNFNVTYEAPSRNPWSIEAFVQNIEGGNIKTLASTYTNASPVSNGVFTNPIWLAQYLPPRTFGVRLKATF
ncbi:MAG TPA: TonB-dependent receptor [Aliidongia sp.]|nr:TonB-dependent receptor [Aliidongia sp.]